MKGITEWIAGGGLIAIFTVLWRSRCLQDESISKVYKRLDAVKEGFESKHVTKDVCEVVNQSIKDDLKEIKSDVKTLMGMVTK